MDLSEVFHCFKIKTIDLSLSEYLKENTVSLSSTELPNSRSFSQTKHCSLESLPIEMPPFPLTGWLEDRILGKRGSKYKIADIEKILQHYNIRPTHCTPRKPYLLQQLSLLTHTHTLTRADRWRITKNRRALDTAAIQASKKLTRIKPPRCIIPQTVQCQACLEDLSSRRFPKRRITLECEHEPLICRSCLHLSIDIQINEKKQFNTLKCPLCPQKLEFRTVKKYASKEAFEQYDYSAALQTLCSMPDFRLCGNPDCGSGQFHEVDEELPIWICQKCGRRMCFKHGVEWHEGVGCEEYEETVGRRRNEENELSLKVLEEVRVLIYSSSLLSIERSNGNSPIANSPNTRDTDCSFH